MYIWIIYIHILFFFSLMAWYAVLQSYLKDQQSNQNTPVIPFKIFINFTRANFEMKGEMKNKVQKIRQLKYKQGETVILKSSSQVGKWHFP